MKMRPYLVPILSFIAGIAITLVGGGLYLWNFSRFRTCLELIDVFHQAGDSAAAQTELAEAIRLAGGAEIGLAEFYQNSSTWPSDLSSVYSTAQQAPAGEYTGSVTGAGSGSTYAILATMQNEGVDENIAGTAIEIWTNDGGNTWHCGPAIGPNKGPDTQYLPTSCRESDGEPTIGQK